MYGGDSTAEYRKPHSDKIKAKKAAMEEFRKRSDFEGVSIERVQKSCHFLAILFFSKWQDFFRKWQDLFRKGKISF